MSKGTLPLEQINTIPEIVKPEAWLTDRPRRVSLETALWLAALAFVEVVLNFDKESWYSFLEIVCQWVVVLDFMVMIIYH